MIIYDMHDHVFPEKIAGRAAGMIGDFYGYRMSGDGTPGELLRWHRENHISHALIHSVAVAPKNVRSINLFISQCAAENPEHFTGFGSIHPDCEDYGEVIRDAKEKGLLGFKLHSDMQKFALDSPKAFEMFEAIEAARMPVLLHAGDPRFRFSNPGQIRALAEHCPELTIIAAHLGGHREWEEAVRLLSCSDNVFTDTSSSLFFMEPEAAAKVIRSYDREKVFFGTDYPMWDTREELDRFGRLPLSDDEKERILGLNAAAFLDSLEGKAEPI